jgi:hypothetical protein
VNDLAVGIPFPQTWNVIHENGKMDTTSIETIMTGDFLNEGFEYTPKGSVRFQNSAIDAFFQIG